MQKPYMVQLCWHQKRPQNTPVEQNFLWRHQANLLWLFQTYPHRIRFPTCTSPITHLICSPKFCITFVFHFSWYNSRPKRNWKQCLCKILGGQKRGIMGDLQVVNDNFCLTTDTLTFDRTIQLFYRQKNVYTQKSLYSHPEHLTSVNC